MDNAKIQHYGDELYQALLERKPVDPLTDRESSITIEDAYQIQLRMIQRRLDAGETIVGKKIGVTSKVVMDMLKVNQPDFGQMTSGMVFNEGEAIRADSMIAPKAEAEVAFVLGRDLTSEHITITDVIGAVDYALPALEIVDSRVAGWNIRILDTVADNASSGLYVLGNEPKRLAGLDLRLCGMVMEVRGEPVSTGAGAACLGHPLNAVLWLARVMARVGRPLSAGDTVLSGALGPMVAVGWGSVVEARIQGLGSVRAAFAKE